MNYWEVVAMPEQSIGLLQRVLTTEAKQREEAICRVPRDSESIFVKQSKLAVIPIRGVLLDEWSPYGPYFGATGYNYIRSASIAAAQDADVSAVVFDINSPGGLVSGMQEAADTIENIGVARSGKPVYAVIRAMGASAAYALAASADRIILSTSAEVGSIGARLVHISIQGMLEKEGVKVTQFAHPAGKASGGMFSDLSETASKRLQASVSDAAEKFIDHVARRRRMKATQVRALDAQMFPAMSATGLKTALEAKLVDAVAPADDTISEILRQSSR